MSLPMGLDVGAVEAWCAAHVPGLRGPFTVEVIRGGQSNPTYALESPSGSFILRRKPMGKLLKSAHAVDREFRVQKALAHSDVPVAGMLGYCDDPGVVGSEFYLMARVPGRVFQDPRLREFETHQRGALMAEMARVLAAIHSVDLEAVGLGDYGPCGAYFRRQYTRWSEQYRASETEPLDEMDALIEALETACPEDDGRLSLVHGDYRLDNLMFAEAGTDCVAVLDWELSTLGHPFADLAGVLMQWRMPPGAEGRGLAGVDRADLGLPSDDEFLARYGEAAGTELPRDFGPYLAFAFFRMAAILQGVKKRALDGNAADPERGLKMGAYVPDFARAGLKALGALGL
ncbi:MAG: phosphotransferase family protein [Pseudomonadota bacterium]